MAGSKSQKAVDDQKKRKRASDVGAETDDKSKRRRKQGKVNGNAKGAQNSNGVKDDVKGSAAALAESKADEDTVDLAEQTEAESGWTISKPMGGRMLDVDPILTEDEQYLILAYNTSLQVYSTADSLLVRRIPITMQDSAEGKTSKPATITAMRLSRTSPNYVWIACSDGEVFRANWTKTTEPPSSFTTKSETAHALALTTTGTAEKPHEAVLVAESDKSHRLDITAYFEPRGRNALSKNILSLKKNGNGIQLLESSDDGKILAGALNDRIFVGSLAAESFEKFEDIRFDFYSFDIPDMVSSLDLKATAKKAGKVSGKKPQPTSGQTVDLAVGGARGAIYVYHDAISRLQAMRSSKSDKDTIEAQKYHWHRRAVHCVKWSRDGNYLISGGSENVLVTWQMDTAKRNYLPHLSGSVENLVVSASGSSYVVHLDDNSTMILSTAEMKPTAYIAGIQSAAVNLSTPKDLLVDRVWKQTKGVHRPIPAAVRPTEPSRLHVCVGNGMQATSTGDHSAPYLQSFDLETFSSIDKQPLARTQPTDVNITSKGVPIDEPLVTNLAFSADGKWMASVDDWRPAEHDLDHVVDPYRDQLLQERHEIHLKFWEVGSGDQGPALVSRINAPHATSRPEAVLDLAASPVSTGFATIGGDGMVRVWRPKVRKSDGIVSKGADGRDLHSWSCSQVIPIGDGLGQEAAVDLVNSTRISQAQGSIAFSEDGSTIFAAFGGVDTGMVYVIDAWSGQVVKVLEDLWTGQLHSIKALSPFLIILSDELRVYDVVSDELRYGITIPGSPKSADLVQLEVDRTSRHFAIVTPIQKVSSIGIFDPEQLEPLLVRRIPHRVVSLVAAPETSGFIALDDSAQVWTVAEESDPSSLAAVQPLEDLRLDSATSGPFGKSVAALIGEDVDMASDGEDEEAQPVIEEDEDVDMDDDTHASIVAPQHLAEIFDAAPSFAGPSVEDMFYKVTSLLSAKPLVASTQ